MSDRRRHPILGWMWLWGPLVVLAVFGGPTLLLHVVATDAERCFASIAARPGVALPDCEHRAQHLEALADLPFIGLPSVRAREEIIARMAVWRYLDAAVGQPDRGRLTEEFKLLKPAGYMIWEGSMRLRMDEVGPPMPVPEPGALAILAGDRRTLDSNSFQWTQHYTATRAMEAVLLEGRLDRAVRLAEHYQGRPNTDLRIRVGALLCAGGRHQLGLDQVTDIERDRAHHRTANFARNFGAARVVIEACSEAGKLEPPPVPKHGEAGAWDHRARLMSMRMRHLRGRYPACDLSDPLACRTHTEVTSNLEHVREILRADKVRRHRLPLFASIADSITSSAIAAKYALPRAGEKLFADRLPFFADQWLDHAPDAPFVPASRYEAAALHISGLDKPDSVRDLVQALFVNAAVGYAQRGELGAADRCLVQAKLDEATLIVMRTNAALVAGDRGAARERVAASAAPRHPRILLLRAALALPDADLARAQATEALAQAEDSSMIERIRWLLVTLGVATRGNTVVREEPFHSPPRYRYTGWPSPLVTRDVRSANVDDALAVWHRWLKADNRRESRYRAFSHRGDAPVGLTPLLHAGARLASDDFSSEQTEIWLDALMAFDARRFSMRQVAFARWRAAVWRGDAEAADVWRTRYRKLAEMAQNPKLADVLHAVRI